MQFEILDRRLDSSHDNRRALDVSWLAEGASGQLNI